MIEAQSNLNIADNGGTTALQHSLSQDKKDAAMLLVEQKASIDYLSEPNLRRILIAAIIANRIKVVEILTNTGMNLNFLYENYKTPLQYAMERKRHGVVELLLRFGADVNFEPAISASIFCKDSELQLAPRL